MGSVNWPGALINAPMQWPIETKPVAKQTFSDKVYNMKTQRAPYPHSVEKQVFAKESMVPRSAKTAQLALYFETSPRYTPAAALAALQASATKSGSAAV